MFTGDVGQGNRVDGPLFILTSSLYIKRGKATRSYVRNGGRGQPSSE